MPDARQSPFYRAASFAREQPAEGNIVRVVASTGEPCDLGSWRETLVHTHEAMDASAACSVLFNHDRNALIGGIRSTKIENNQCVAELEIDPDAKTETGLKLLDAIRKRYIRGVSIGYDYRNSDCEITKDDMGKKTVTVNRWELREISITPSQADTAAQVLRALPDGLVRATAAHGKEASTMPAETKNAQEPQGAQVAVEHENELKRAREAAETRARDVAALARSHGLAEPEKYIGSATPEADMLRALAAQKAQTPTQTAAVRVDVTADARDKACAAAEDAMLNLIPSRMGEDKTQVKFTAGNDLGMRSSSPQAILRRFAATCGFNSDAMGMDKIQLAQWALGRGWRNHGGRDAANITSGMFATYVLANVLDKAVQKGFNCAMQFTYPLWCTQRTVADFKSFTGAALDTGNLKETTENIAFPELTRGEGGYSDSLGLWGGTLSLTLQALVNDDLGEFMASLGRSGYLAQRTIEKSVFTKLAAATWTNHTQTSGTLAESTVDSAKAAMEVVTGPSGDILGISPRFLIVPSCLRTAALKICYGALNGITAQATTILPHLDMTPIITPFLASITTKANSTWYLAADPACCDTVVVAKLQGMESPVVEEYDAGAVAARKYKVMMPFVATVPTGLYGMYQSTIS